MQWEHVVMLAGEDLVTDLNDQLMGLVLEPLAGMVRVGGGFLFRIAYAIIISRGIRSLPMLKCSRERWV